MDEEKRRTVIYRTKIIERRKINITTEEEMEEAFDEIRENITFYTRGSKYISIKVKFVNKELVAMHPTKILKTSE